jgi:hypothetical protein
MAEHLLKNWPIYILLAGFIWFVASVTIHANKEENKRQEQEKNKQG